MFNVGVRVLDTYNQRAANLSVVLLLRHGPVIGNAQCVAVAPQIVGVFARMQKVMYENVMRHQQLAVAFDTYFVAIWIEHGGWPGTEE